MAEVPDGKTTFAPVRTQRTFEIICDQIRTRLLDGTLRAGDKLPAERELAAELQVSRNALREALRSLEVAGIIRNVKGVKGGAFIQSAEPDRIVQAMRDYVHLGDITLEELTEARLAIQDIIVRLACKRGSASDFRKMAEIAERTRHETDVDRRYQCAVEFYDVLAKATGNRMFGLFVETLSAILHEFVTGPGYEVLQDQLIESRFRLIEHMRARDEEAAAAEMRKHLERIDQHVRKSRKPKRSLRTK
jgi:DNA-binding FadR family transcriptional regulator